MEPQEGQLMHPQMVNRRIPPLAWVLVSGAALHLGLWVWVNGYRVFGPHLILRIEDVSSIVTGIGPFLLGAAALLGAARWPAGRRWLVVGAALSGLHGLGQLALDAWWAWSIAANALPADGVTQAAAIALALVTALAAALAVVCLAIGMARAPSSSPLSASLMAVPLAVGAAAVVGAVAVMGREVVVPAQLGDVQGAPYLVLGVVHRIVATAGVIGMVALAVAALRAMPARFGMPELVIAVGALIVAGARTWTWFGLALLPPEPQSGDAMWVFAAQFAMEAAGLVLLVVGFGLAAAAVASPRIEADLQPPGPMRTPAG